MNKSLFLIIFCFILVKTIAYQNIELNIPDAPKAPPSIEKKEKYERNPEFERKKSVEDINLRLLIQNAAIFLDMYEKGQETFEFNKTIFATALCQQSFPIVVSRNTFKLLNLSSEDIFVKAKNFMFENSIIYKNKEEDFYLIFPKKYILTLQSINDPKVSELAGNLNYTPLDILTGFKLSTLSIYSKNDPISQDSSFNIENLKKLFLENINEFPIKWNIALFGHGIYSKKLEKEIREGLYQKQLAIEKNKYDDAYIAGLPLNDFRNLIQFFINNINTNFLYYTSCYAGGYNKILPFLPTLINEKGNIIGLQKPKFIIATGSIMDSVVFSTADSLKNCLNCLNLNNDKEKGDCYAKNSILENSINFSAFFEQLRKFTNNAHNPTVFKDNELKQILTNITFKNLKIKEDPLGISTLPQVLLPMTDTFIAIDITGRVMPLGKVLVKKHEIEKYSILTKGKNVILLYPNSIDVPLYIFLRKNEITNIISMIPGMSIQKINTINIIYLENNFDYQTFNPLIKLIELLTSREQVFEKYYYIEQLKSHNIIYCKNILIKVKTDQKLQQTNVDVIYQYNNKIIYIKYFNNQIQEEKILNFEFQTVTDNNFVNSILNYFFNIYKDQKLIRNAFSFNILLNSLNPDDNENFKHTKIKFDQYLNKLTSQFIGFLQNEFPNLLENPDELSKNGNLALNIAITNKNKAAINYLLNTLNADPNIRDAQGNTPLLIATKDNNEDIVEILNDTNKLSKNVKEEAINLADQKKYSKISAILSNIKVGQSFNLQQKSEPKNIMIGSNPFQWQRI